MTANNIKPLYFVINSANDYIEESNGNKYLIPISADESKDMLKKYEDI